MEIWEVEEGGAAPIEGLLEDGTPDPAYAAALGLVSAPLGRRAAAFALEYAVWLVLQLPLWIFMIPLMLKLATGRIGAYGFLNHPDFKLAAIMAGITFVLTLGYLVAQLVLHGTRGVTLGKALFGIRSVNVATLGKPGVGRVLLRALLLWAAGIAPFGSLVVLLSPLFDKSGRGRGWHDNVGRLWLVDIRAGLDPYDEKRMRVARKTLSAAPRAEREALPSLTGGAGEPAFHAGGRLSAGVIGRADVGSDPGVPSAQVGGALATPVPGGGPGPGGAAAPGGALRPEPVVPPAQTPVVQTPVIQPPPPPAPAPPAAAPATFVLSFGAGLEIAVDGPLVLGRNPKPPAGLEARPVVMADEQLSRTHVVVRPAPGGGDGLELIDVGSSNGTAVTHQGIERQLVADQPSVAHLGDTIQIGQLTATVRRG